MNTKEFRRKTLENMKNKFKFNGKLLIVGCGAIGSGLLPLIINVIDINPSQITIIDKQEKALARIKPDIASQINIYNKEITRDNLKIFIIDELNMKQDDVILDCSYNIGTDDWYNICATYGISYANSSIEDWADTNSEEDEDYTISSRYLNLEKVNSTFDKKKCNFIISLGCNPGNVSIWTLYGLYKINQKIKKNKFNIDREGYSNDWALLAKNMGLNVVQISEKDSQKTINPKKDNEYTNTWSSDATSFYDESQGPVEISWGTHELTLPPSYNPKQSNEYQIIIDEKGCDKYGITYSPISKNVLGMVIRHEECFTICRKLSIRDKYNKIIYKPTSFYVYQPSNSTMMSIYELKERNFIYQDNLRLLTNDIIEGRDELGVTMFFADKSIYWIGSLLDIEEARYIYNNQYNDIINCTSLQVISGYFGSFIHIINNINNKIYKGLLYPEDMPIRDFMKWTKPLLGNFVIIKVNDWNPITAKYERKYIHNQKENNTTKPLWQYSDFIIN